MQIPPEVFYVIGVAILAVALVWGISRSRSRNRANDSVTEAATKEEYEHPESYNEEKFRDRLRSKK